MRDIVEKHRVELPTFVLTQAGLDRNACLPQNARAPARDERVGVRTADKHVADPVFYDRVRAGLGAAPVAARLERDVQIRACGVLGAVFQRVALGV